MIRVHGQPRACRGQHHADLVKPQQPADGIGEQAVRAGLKQAVAHERGTYDLLRYSCRVGVGQALTLATLSKRLGPIACKALACRFTAMGWSRYVGHSIQHGPKIGHGLSYE